MGTLIAIKNLSKTFREEHSKTVEALRGVNLEIKEGELLVLLGPSGSGKSTILRIMSGLEKDYGGEVKYGAGINRSDFSFVFQQFALLPWLTVAENVGLGLVGRGMSRLARTKRVGEELKLFGLEKFAHSYPRELSGGMKQRAGIARALATDPRVIFLDEPFSELDSFTADTLRQELLKIWGERRLTVILVSHNIEEALELSDRIAVLTSRPGMIEKVLVNGLPRPRNRRSKEFFALEDELYKLVKP